MTRRRCGTRTMNRVQLLQLLSSRKNSKRREWTRTSSSTGPLEAHCPLLQFQRNKLYTPIGNPECCSLKRTRVRFSTVGTLRILHRILNSRFSTVNTFPKTPTLQSRQCPLTTRWLIKTGLRKPGQWSTLALSRSKSTKAKAIWTRAVKTRLWVRWSQEGSFLLLKAPPDNLLLEGRLKSWFSRRRNHLKTICIRSRSALSRLTLILPLAVSTGDHCWSSPWVSHLQGATCCRTWNFWDIRNDN